MNPFNNISNSSKNKLLLLLDSKMHTFKKNESVLNNYRKENIIGIVEKGNIQLIKDNDNGTNILKEYRENDVFTTNVDLNKLDMNLISKEDSTVILIDYDYIIENLNNEKKYFNDFIKNLFVIYNDLIIELNERIEILSKKTIRSKLLTYFNIRYNQKKSKYIYLPYNYKDLAEYLAIDRTAMTREMKYLKEDGFIETKGKRITLLYKKR